MLLGAGSKTRSVAVDEEARDAVGAGFRIGLGEHHVDVGNGAVGDEGLRAVQNVLVTVEHRRGAHGRHVRSGVGLGEAEGGEPVVLGLLHEMARLLLGAVQKDVAEGDEVRDEGVSVSGVNPGQLLEYHGAGLVA